MLLAKNRKAFHEYSVLEKYVAGVVLKGYEVKAIREGKVSFEGSYVEVAKSTPLLVNLHIARYTQQSQPFSDEQARYPRKLLLHQNEIKQISRYINEKGVTAIPLAFILEHNLIKLELGIVKGLKKFEKKSVQKDRQIKRDMEREASTWG